MNKMVKLPAMAVAALAVLGFVASADAQEKAPPASQMTFFVTSAGSGKGADLGGLEGADRICQRLAQNAGAGGHTWKAYLSTQAAGGKPAVNARDRIGKGPWKNREGITIAKNVAELHGNNNIDRYTGLTEKGELVNGRGSPTNDHDVLTGSQPDGTAFGPGEDRTCGNWTKSGAEGVAMLGHMDRLGLTDDPVAMSWNSTHTSRGGCSTEALRSTGGAGLFYCFAAK